MRIVLNTSPEVDKELIAFSHKAGKSINQMLIDLIESKYLQVISTDTACLNGLITDAIDYAKKHPIGTRFTVSDLQSINLTMLQNEVAGKRSVQRAKVTKKFIKEVKSGAVANVCCLLDSSGDAIKIKRNSAFVITDSVEYDSINPKITKLKN